MVIIHDKVVGSRPLIDTSERHDAGLALRILHEDHWTAP